MRIAPVILNKGNIMLVDVNQEINDTAWQRLQWVSFSKVVAAGENNAKPVEISDDGHFFCKYLGGMYTTLTAADTDGGACGTSVKISDNGRKWDIMDNLTPMSIFTTPGRQRSSGVAGDPGNPLFSPIEFDYKFQAGTSIRVEYANNLAFANTIWLVFYGMKMFKEAQSIPFPV